MTINSPTSGVALSPNLLFPDSPGCAGTCAFATWSHSSRYTPFTFNEWKLFGMYPLVTRVPRLETLGASASPAQSACDEGYGSTVSCADGGESERQGGSRAHRGDRVCARKDLGDEQTAPTALPASAYRASMDRPAAAVRRVFGHTVLQFLANLLK
jgi:hypothetical protein